MSKKEYILEGLCCPNCAAKIEKEVNDIAEVHEASLNLMNQQLSISLKSEVNELTEVLKEIVASYEPSVKVREITKKTAGTEQTADAKEKDTDTDRVSGMGLKLYSARLGAAVILSVVFTLLTVPEVVKLAAYIIAYALVGYETFTTAARNILKGKVFDENFLMGIASLGAFLMGDRNEAVAVLVFYSVGELFQNMAVNRSRRNIAGLMDIRPDYANKIMGDTTITVEPGQVEVGDRILVKPGERIPLDGTIVSGSGFIDTRALTGESVPQEVSAEDTVLSGSVNMSGVLEIEVTKLYGESTVAKILELVQNAGSKKAESEKFITKFAGYYTPGVVAAAAAVAVFPPLLGFGPFTVWLYRALSFLIISCPCALVISIPLSYFGGIGGGARQGILVKGGNYLDALRQVDTIVFDKTGTLTKGVFEVTKLCPADGTEASELLRYAAITENNSNHPIARSIIAYYSGNRQESVVPADKITEIAGQGIEAELDGAAIYAGNDKLMQKSGIQVNPVKETGSIVHVAVDGRYLGYLLISDEIKPGAKDAIEALKQLGVRHTVMLTGDRKNTAQDIAEQCRIDEFKAELLPQDKVAWFDQYKDQSKDKGKIVFVGDGINDAPVLAGADIGIAMGGIGSDAAIESADVVIMKDEPGKIVTAIRIARKTRQIVLQNIIFALGIKLLIMILAFFGISSIWFAIFADVGVALLALFNAMRAMYIK